MTQYRSQQDFRIITVLLSILAILAAACGNADDSDPVPVAWQPLPADGKCRSEMVLRPGESCTHEYSYEAGSLLSASGFTPFIETVVNDFVVDADGVARYGGTPSISGSPTDISRSLTIGDMVFKFIAYAQSDGTFYIEEATTNDSFLNQPDTPSADDCSVGMVLSEGESCALSDGRELSVDAGKVCLGPSFCVGGNLTIAAANNELSVVKNDDGTRTIASLP